MFSKIGTKAVFAGFILLLVWMASLTLPNAGAGSANHFFAGSSHHPILSSDHSGLVSECTGRTADLHTRVLTHSKSKVKSLLKKHTTNWVANAVQTYTPDDAHTPIFSNWAGITKPAYYLFLFRYTLF